MVNQTGKCPEQPPPRQLRAAGKNLTSCTCIPLNPDTVEATARLYTEVFVREESTTRWHGIIEEDFLPFARMYVQFCENQGLSFIAHEEKTGEVIGFIICHDLTMDLDALGPAMQEYLSCFDATIQLISALEEKYLNIIPVTPGTALHVYQLGISREFQNRLVSTPLIRHMLASARERGFHTIVTDCTGPGSCRSFEKCGFTRAGSIAYSSFLVSGTAFFDGFEGEITLMVKVL
ncbi:MAG: GNAT family N-acetyltransferase [Methanoregula sp.]|jgi:ribosomal protein S18 acetylase RimI-like enzyme